MTLPRAANRFQFPNQLEQKHQHDVGSIDYRVRWVARRCKVSLATAATLAINAGLLDREDR